MLIIRILKKYKFNYLVKKYSREKNMNKRKEMEHEILSILNNVNFEIR